MKFTYIMGTSCRKLGLFCHKVVFIINTVFPPLRETLYAGRIKLFAETSELFTYAVFQLFPLYFGFYLKLCALPITVFFWTAQNLEKQDW
jgi:hypothetical protein